MRVSRFALWALVLPLAAPGCRDSKDSKDSKKKEEKAAPEPSSESVLDDVKNKANSLVAQGSSTTKNLWNKGVKLGSGAIDKATGAVDTARNWGSESVDELRAEAITLVKQAKGGIGSAHTTVNGLLEDIARTSDKVLSSSEKLSRMMVLMLPVIGPSKRYLDARHLYERGEKAKSDDLKQEARRELLIACAEAGLDIGMLGIAGSGVDLVATGADKALGVLKVTRSMQTLVGANLSSFDRFLDELLEDDALRSTIDGALTVDLATITG